MHGHRRQDSRARLHMGRQDVAVDALIGTASFITTGVSAPTPWQPQAQLAAEQFCSLL